MIAFVVVLSAFGSLLHAEEERPTVEHVLDFLKEKMPESMDLLERVKEEEGEEGYAEVVESAADLLMEYLEIKREEGAEAAEKFLNEERTGVRMESLVEAWHEADDEAGEREIRKEIGKLIGAQIDREIEHGHRELEKLKEEVEEIEEELAEMKESREEIIAEELREILSDDEEREGEEQEEEGDGENAIKQSWSQEKNYARPYWVNIPELDDGEVLPVIIFLHGNGGNARGLQRMVLNRYPRLPASSSRFSPKATGRVGTSSRNDQRQMTGHLLRRLFVNSPSGTTLRKMTSRSWGFPMERHWSIKLRLRRSFPILRTTLVRSVP